MNFALILTGIIIGGLLTLLSLILAIVSLSTGKSRNALIWGIAFIVSLAIAAFSVFMMAKRLSEKVTHGIEWIKEHENDYKTTQSDTDSEYKKSDRQYFLDTLQKYTNEKYEGTVPADFYLNSSVKPDANGLLKVPFVYPYYILYNPATYTGNIMMETSDSIFVENVTAMAFDQNFALVRVDNSLSPELLKANHAETEYLLYDLRTRNFESAANKEKLLDLGRRIGYTGSTDLIYLSESYRGWIPDTSY